MGFIGLVTCSHLSTREGSSGTTFIRDPMLCFGQASSQKVVTLVVLSLAIRGAGATEQPEAVPVEGAMEASCQLLTDANPKGVFEDVIAPPQATFAGCCLACLNMTVQENLPCNIWVWCGQEDGCKSGAPQKTPFGECHLEFQPLGDEPVALWESGPEVPWTSGSVPSRMKNLEELPSVVQEAYANMTRQAPAQCEGDEPAPEFLCETYNK